MECNYLTFFYAFKGYVIVPSFFKHSKLLFRVCWKQLDVYEKLTSVFEKQSNKPEDIGDTSSRHSTTFHRNCTNNIEQTNPIE